MAIVTYAHRYKRPPRKRKPVAIEVPAVVRGKTSPDATFPAVVRKAKPDTDNRADPATSHHDGTRSAIVTTTSRKQSKLLLADKRAPATDGDPEMRAWLLRAMHGGWPRDD